MLGRESRSGIHTAASAAVVVAALYFAKDFLLPLALAALLSFLLHPLLVRLERVHVPRLAALALIALAVVTAVGLIGWLVGSQVTDLAASLPDFRANLVEKLRALRGPLRSLADAMGWIDRLSKEVDPSRGQGGPAQVEIVEPQAAITTLTRFLSPLLGVLGVAGVVTLLTLFLLFQRDLPERISSFLLLRDSRISPRALDEAGQLVTRYLERQGLVCLIQGVVVATGLGLIGVPGFLLFGVISGALRLIPYFGPSVAASLPILFCLASFKGWSMAAYTAGFFVVLELFTSNVLDPRVLGRGAGLSPLGVILAASFWAWLWGPAGLFVAIPLTACLSVVGRYVPQLAFVPALVAHDQMLSPCDRLYERLAARDVGEAATLLRHAARESDLLELSDALVLPVLARLAEERASGARSGADVVRFLRAFRELLAEATTGVTAPAPARATAARTVQLLQFRSGAVDRFARDWLASMLQQCGFEVQDRTARPAAEDASALLVVLAPVGESGLSPTTRLRLFERANGRSALLLAPGRAGSEPEIGGVSQIQVVRTCVALVGALAPPIPAVAPVELRSPAADGAKSA